MRKRDAGMAQAGERDRRVGWREGNGKGNVRRETLSRSMKEEGESWESGSGVLEGGEDAHA